MNGYFEHLERMQDENDKRNAIVDKTLDNVIELIWKEVGVICKSSGTHLTSYQIERMCAYSNIIKQIKNLKQKDNK